MRSVLCLSAVLALASAASATPILWDNFESYTTQAEFEAAWPPITAGASGQLSTDQSYSPPKSIFFAATPSTWNNRRNFPETVGTDSAPLVWSFRFYDADTTVVTRNYGQLHDAVDPNGASALTQLIAIGTWNSAPAVSSTRYAARVAFMPGGGTAPAWFLLDDPGAPTRSVGWHELKAVIKTSVIDFYVDGILSKANVPYRTAPAVVSFDQVRLNSGLTSLRAAYMDDVLIIPEPATLTLAVLGGLLLVRRR